MELRDYQAKLIADLRAAIAGGAKTPVVELPTGGGKTAVALEIARLAKAKGKTVAVLVERVVLADQWAAAAAAQGMHAGIVQAERGRYGDDITCYSQQTIESRAVKTAAGQGGETGAKVSPWPFEDVVFVDECHEARSMITDWIRDRGTRPAGQLVIGLTATPMKPGLGDTYDAHVKGPTTDALTEAGWLVPAEYLVGVAKIDMSGAKVNHASESGYYAQDIDEMTGHVIGDIVQEWFDKSMELGDGSLFPTVCYSATVASGKKIMDEANSRFGSEGFEVARQVSYLDKTGDREETLKMFKRGDLPLLINVGVLNRGFDAPNARMLLDCSPYRSKIGSYAQMIGRVLRPVDGKARPGEKAYIIDFCQNIMRLESDWLSFRKHGCLALLGDKAKRGGMRGKWVRVRFCLGCNEWWPKAEACACGQEAQFYQPVELRWRCGNDDCETINDPRHAVCRAEGCEAPRPAAPGRGEEEAAKGWTCEECETANQPTDYTCTECGQPKPKTWDEVDGTVARYEVGGEGMPQGVQNQAVDGRSPQSRRYVWAHMMELGRRHYLKRQKRVTPLLDEKAKRFAQARFMKFTGKFPVLSPITTCREPDVDPRVQAFWDRMQAEAREAAVNAWRPAQMEV